VGAQSRALTTDERQGLTGPGHRVTVAVPTKGDIDGEGPSAPPDRVTLLFGVPPSTSACVRFGPADAAPFLMAIEHGNIQVRL